MDIEILVNDIANGTNWDMSHGTLGWDEHRDICIDVDWDRLEHVPFSPVIHWDEMDIGIHVNDIPNMSHSFPMIHWDRMDIGILVYVVIGTDWDMVLSI